MADDNLMFNVPLSSRRRDLDEYMSDLMYGQRSTMTPFEAGPLSGSVNEVSMRSPSLYPMLEQDPETSANIRLKSGDRRGGGSVGFNVQRQPDGQMSVRPDVGVNFGPLGLTAGLDLRRQDDQTTITPRLGANLDIPVGSAGNASLRAMYTPQQLLELAAQYRHQIDPQSEAMLGITHTRPYGGTPDTRFGAAYRRFF